MSLNVTATTGKFRTANPKLYDAFLAALAEATTRINDDMPAAAELYRRVTKDQISAEDLVAMMKQPGVEFTLVPKGVAPIAAFMFKVGTIKTSPASRKDLFFANVHDQAGS
jgi:sulfonate transport system substrate-binding protein